MRTASTDLYDLIQSLTVQEKRYVKRMSIGQDTSFLRLMDAISAQKTYDETRLKKENKEEKFIKNLAVNKKYLYDYLLNVLVRFRKKEEEFIILQGIIEVGILEEKELPAQALKMILRLKRKATDLGLYPLVLQLLELEKWNLGIHILPSKIKNIYAESNEIQEKIKNIHEYWNIYIQVYMWHLKYQKKREEKDRDLLKTWLDNPLLNDISHAISVESQLYFYQIKATLYFSLARVEDAFICNMDYLNILDEHPKYLRRFSEKYLAVYNNLLIDALTLGKSNVFEEGILRIRKMPLLPTFKNTPYIAARVFRQSFILEMNALLQSDKITEGIARLPEIKAGLANYKDKIALHYQFILHYLAAYFLFKNKQFHEALDWIHPLLQYHKTDIVQQVLQAARLLNLIVHFEMENDEHVLHLVKTYRRYIRQKRQLLDSEKHLLHFLASHINFQHTAKEKELALSFQNQLENTQNQTVEKQFSQIFNMMEWWESRKR